MAKFYEVKKFPGCGGLYAAVNSKGETVTELTADRNRALLDGHHWSHAPTAFKKLGFKKLVNTTPTTYRARPFWGVEARITKVGDSWFIRITVDGDEAATRSYPTRDAACKSVYPYGREMLETRNILNPEAGPIMIARSEKGGCTDPGTETYHCM